MSDTKLKFDYEIEDFEAAFKDKKELKIVIYGIGRMTATLLERLKGFRIIGLLDRDSSMIGKEIYGLRVMSREETEKNADIIVINTSEAYWGTIYKRIQNWEIPVYFRNGVRASKEFLHESEDNPYWQKNSAELEKKMEQYEVISFDIFDTLIMRKVYLPTDIFHIVERKLRSELGENFTFFEIRKKTASVCDNATIDEIYDEIEKTQNWDCELTKKVKQCEIDVEKQFIVPRKDVIMLYNAIKDSKEVYFISDMYLTKNILAGILEKCGIIIPEDKIIVSCDYKRSKEDGSLWEYYAENLIGGRKALHIGDNEKTDGELPNRYGIDSYTIWSAEKMLQASSIANIVPDISKLYSSIYVGMLETKLLNSPFALHETKGKISFENELAAGYCLLGGLAFVFFRWLLKKAKEDRVKQLVFFAREGYFLTELFKDYCWLAGEKEVPQVTYLEISRRAVMVAAIQDLKDVYEVAEYFPYTGNLKDFLKDRFGVIIDDRRLEEIDYKYAKENKPILQEVLKKYEKEILSEASRERHNYLTYLEKMKISTDFAVIDSQLYGAAQYYLGKLLGKNLKGYYFCACLDKANRYLVRNIMEGCFPAQKGLDGRDANIFKNTVFIEAFFTAPNGMLEYIDDAGEKKYSEKKQNQINFDVRFEMSEGIREYMKDIIDLCQKYQIDLESEDIFFTDKIFGVFLNNGFEATAKMKKSFFYDNGILGKKEVPIWE